MAASGIKMRTMRNKQLFAPLPNASEPTPWIVIQSGERRLKQDFFNICSGAKKSFDRNIPEILGKVCLASMHGWLVLKNLNPKKNGRVRCFMWNPQTRNIINLPLKNSEDIDMLNKCYLTSPPSDPNCMVLFASKTFFLFCHPQDRKWRKESYQLPKDGIIVDNDFIDKIVTCYNGTIYALTYWETIVKINRTGGSLSVSLENIEKPRLAPTTSDYIKYVLEFFGDIYLVVIGWFSTREEINHTEVFCLNVSNKTWVKVPSIGEVVFIISYYGCMALSVANSGMEGNRIFFTREEDSGLYIYGLADESLSIYSACPNSETYYFTPFWLLPDNRVMEISKEKADTTISNDLTTEEMHSIIAAKAENTKDGEVSCWSDLTMDLLWLITTHLPFDSDYMNVRLVCKTWKVFPPIRLDASVDKRCPWLVFSNREICKYSFLDLVSNVKLNIDIPKLLEARIWFSKDSWLLMSRGYCSVFFYNPFNCVTVKLPDLPRGCSRYRMSFSSLPTSLDCIVFGVKSFSPDFIDMCYTRIRDKDWTMIKCKKNEVPFNLSLCSPIFHDGAFYCLSYERHLGVFRLKDDDRWKWTILASQEPYSFMHLNYLVECKGYLLSVTVGSKGKWVEVHKLDCSNVSDCSNMTWMIQNSLEDQAVFISDSTSIALQGANKSMQNKIYFPLSLDGDNNHVFFSLETGRWHSSCNNHSAKDIFGTKQYLHCTWIQPPVSWKYPLS